mgnify:CR=1 FL=1
MINSGLFKINGHTYKAPSNLAPVISTLVDSGRNTNGTVVGQKVGRDIYKLNNLQWNMLSVAEWRDILAEFGDFYVEISFFAPDTASWKTLKMYPGDRTCEYPKGEMWYNDDGSPKVWFNCKANIIDIGEM